jgi:parvulin-like peptidyl-prolyl isomerase
LNCKREFDPQNSKETIAVVGSFYISKLDLENEIKSVDEKVEDPAILSRIYDSLVEETLMLNEFFKNQSNGKINSLGEFAESKRRKEIISLLLEENVYSKIEITNEEVEDYYNSNQEKFKKGEGFLIRQIIVSGVRLKDEAYSLLLKNYSFEEVARLYSISPEKGKPQYFETKEIPEYLLSEVLTLKEGKFSKPIEISDDNFQIIYLEKKVKDYLLPLDMVRQMIRLKIADEKAEKMREDFLNSLKKKYNVVLFTDRLWFKYVKEK